MVKQPSISNNLCLLDHSVEVNAIPAQVTLQNQQAISMATTTAEQLDDKVSRRKLIGDVPSILGAFEAAWAPRWKKHDEVPSEEWQAARNFLKAALPSRQTSFPPLTPELWRKTINRKRQGAARGPDRVSKQDLLNIPPAILGQLLQLIREVEQGQPWPSQVTAGIVAALAKTPTAKTTKQFRPTCIFSLTYRGHQ